MQGMAERRVAKLAGLTVDELWLYFQRTNLINYHPGRKGRHEKHVRALTGYTKHMGDGDTFPAEEARDAAGKLPLNQYSCAILLGLNVAKAFVQVRPPASQLCPPGGAGEPPAVTLRSALLPLSAAADGGPGSAWKLSAGRSLARPLTRASPGADVEFGVSSHSLYLVWLLSVRLSPLSDVRIHTLSARYPVSGSSLAPLRSHHSRHVQLQSSRPMFVPFRPFTSFIYWEML